MRLQHIDGRVLCAQNKGSTFSLSEGDRSNGERQREGDIGENMGREKTAWEFSLYFILFAFFIQLFIQQLLIKHYV